MTTRMRRAAVTGLLTSLSLFGLACSDEDSDGATTDEEVEQLDDTADDVRDQVEQEVDEGAEEVDE